MRAQADITVLLSDEPFIQPDQSFVFVSGCTIDGCMRFGMVQCEYGARFLCNRCVSRVRFTTVLPQADISVVLADISVVLANEPIVLTDEPVILTDEPVILTDEPIVLTDEPIVLTDEPVIFANITE
eukprot:COSAG02_NODE_542_length_20590_cov_9.193060_5_plen_127_part_00